MRGPSGKTCGRPSSQGPPAEGSGSRASPRPLGLRALPAASPSSRPRRLIECVKTLPSSCQIPVLQNNGSFGLLPRERTRTQSNGSLLETRSVEQTRTWHCTPQGRRPRMFPRSHSEAGRDPTRSLSTSRPPPALAHPSKHRTQRWCQGWRAWTKFGINHDHPRGHRAGWGHRRASGAEEASSPRHQNIWVNRETRSSITLMPWLCGNSWALAGISSVHLGGSPSQIEE